MDYRSLLKKYISHVRMEEGTAFIGGVYEPEMLAAGMTEEECKELERLADEGDSSQESLSSSAQEGEDGYWAFLATALKDMDSVIARVESKMLPSAIASSLRQEEDGTLTYVAPNYLADLKPSGEGG